MVDQNLIFCTCNLYLIVIRCVSLFTIHNDTVHIQPDQGQMHCYTSVIHEAKWLLNQVASCMTRRCHTSAAAMVDNERTDQFNPQDIVKSQLEDAQDGRSPRREL